MTARKIADERHGALCNEHAAVAFLRLPDGATSLLARDDNGTPTAAEYISYQGDAVDVEDALRELGNQRARALVLAEQATDHIVGTLAVQLRAGADVNLSQVARDTGIARQTLYNRLRELGIDP